MLPSSSLEFHIHDPDDPDAVYLLDAVIRACDKGERGGGIFSFASPSGAKLLLEDDTFRAFARKGAFQLVVGIDAVTTLAALDAITLAMTDFPHATVRAFLNDRQGTLFHPKMCWFAAPQGGTIIVGSGNLTAGGLRDNWESFTIGHLDVVQMQAFERWWLAWLDKNDNRLLPLDDERVRHRASKNVAWTAGGGPPGAKAKAAGSAEPPDGHLLPPASRSQKVLVAEIPGRPPPGGHRWEQANFDKGSFTRFFGATPGNQIRIFLQNVTLQGGLGEVESRPSVDVKSHNYRFELGAAKGRTYPGQGRPIGVFVRVATRQFVYQLVMPGDEPYPVLDAFLSRHWSGLPDRMRRVEVEADKLRREWPNKPFWQAVSKAPKTPSV